MACLGGSCCAFSNSSMAPYYGPLPTGGTGLLDTGTTNCTACNNVSRTTYYGYGSTSAQYQCSACNAGSQLFDHYGGYQCRQTCDPSTEHRRYSSDVLCTERLSPGSDAAAPAPAPGSDAAAPAPAISPTGSQVGGSCSSSVDCYGANACLSGTCCAFSTSSMAPYYGISRTGGYSPGSNGYGWWDTGTTNCTACNDASWTAFSGNIANQCSACKAGSQLFDSGSYYGGAYGGYHGGYKCQQTCDPATEFRTRQASLICSKKYSAGSSCSSSSISVTGDSTCLSGLCGGSYCYSEAAAAELCGLCESDGACSNKSQIGGSCTSSADCYEDSACLSDTCCAFSNSSMAPYYGISGSSDYGWWDTGTTNCTACNNASRTTSYYGSSSVQYQCSACKAGSHLFDYWRFGYQCRQTCDPSTEYRRYSSHVLCTEILSSGSYCSTGDASCLSGLCGGSYCCSEAAAGLNNCIMCASGRGFVYTRPFLSST